jgi:mRNA-degrading endonuclease RelE of RelBE toxin-antitoxin system
MALEVVFYRRAQKELQGLPKTDRERVLDRLSAYAADPENPLTQWSNW